MFFANGWVRSSTLSRSMRSRSSAAHVHHEHSPREALALADRVFHPLSLFISESTCQLMHNDYRNSEMGNDAPKNASLLAFYKFIKTDILSRVKFCKK